MLSEKVLFAINDIADDKIVAVAEIVGEYAPVEESRRKHTSVRRILILAAVIAAFAAVAAAAYPALAELAGYYHGRVGGWPRFFHDRPEVDAKRTVQRADALDALVEQKVLAGEYYDVVNFARQIQSPVWMQIGYNDQVCCPTSTYSAYNVITAPKQLHVGRDTGHWLYPWQTEMAMTWLKEQLK